MREGCGALDEWNRGRGKTWERWAPLYAPYGDPVLSTRALACKAWRVMADEPWETVLLADTPTELVAFVRDLKLPSRYAIALNELGYDDVGDFANFDAASMARFRSDLEAVQGTFSVFVSVVFCGTGIGCWR